MKSEHPITVNRKREKAPQGGVWQQADPVARGRVQILPAGNNVLTQAVAVVAELQRLEGLSPAWSWTKAAVIAREWKYLDPVRSFCELHGIPVQMADESNLYFWRLRETQAMIGWLDARKSKLISAAELGQWLDCRPDGNWWSLLREAVDEYALETGGVELPGRHFIEWLVDWGREARRRQTGLMLLSGHRAKGLEFDHVAVLDGGWQRVGKNEDRDAGRRLYYVAMTRARQTLILARFASGHVLLDGFPDEPCVLRRPETQLPQPTPELARRYLRLTPADVDLGFAGRYGPRNGLHKAIEELAVDDSLVLRQAGERYELLTSRKNVVGRLSRNFHRLRG